MGDQGGNGSQRFECSYCHKVFVSRRMLVLHLFKAHSKPPK